MCMCFVSVNGGPCVCCMFMLNVLAMLIIYMSFSTYRSSSSFFGLLILFLSCQFGLFYTYFACISVEEKRSFTIWNQTILC